MDYTKCFLMKIYTMQLIVLVNALLCHLRMEICKERKVGGRYEDMRVWVVSSERVKKCATSKAKTRKKKTKKTATTKKSEKAKKQRLKYLCQSTPWGAF
jgi:hypothetical protein